MAVAVVVVAVVMVVAMGAMVVMALSGDLVSFHYSKEKIPIIL